jgi:glutathione peroxidase
MSNASQFIFKSADGGLINLEDFKGKPVLIVNTASRCGFTGQLETLQKLSDAYISDGLTVLAVPSNDFNQELASIDAVKEFCTINYNLTLPMTEITSVRGKNAHPFFKWVKDTTGFSPKWNFNKILIGPSGEIVQTFGSLTRPTSGVITNEIEKLLEQEVSDQAKG